MKKLLLLFPILIIGCSPTTCVVQGEITDKQFMEGGFLAPTGYYYNLDSEEWFMSKTSYEVGESVELKTIYCHDHKEVQ